MVSGQQRSAEGVEGGNGNSQCVCRWPTPVIGMYISRSNLALQIFLAYAVCNTFTYAAYVILLSATMWSMHMRHSAECKGTCILLEVNALFVIYALHESSWPTVNHAHIHSDSESTLPAYAMKLRQMPPASCKCYGHTAEVQKCATRRHQNMLYSVISNSHTLAAPGRRYVRRLPALITTT